MFIPSQFNANRINRLILSKTRRLNKLTPVARRENWVTRKFYADSLNGFFEQPFQNWVSEMLGYKL